MIPKSTTRRPSSGRRGSGAARRRRGSASGRSPGDATELVVVLPRLRGAVAEADAGPVELEKAARQPAVHPGRDLRVDERATRPEVRGGQHLGDVQDRRDRHPAGLALGGDRVLRQAGEQRGVERVQISRCLEPRRDRVVALVLEGGGLPEPRAHRPPLARRQHDDAHAAVGAPEDRVQAGLRTPARRGERGRTAHGGGAVRGVHDLRRRLEDREVDVIPASGLKAVPVGDERRPRRLDRGRLIRHPRRRVQRIASGQARAAEDPAHRHVDRVVAVPVAVVAALAEVGDRGDHELRVASEHLVGAEPQRRQHPRARRLDPDVRRLEQRQQALAIGRRVEVERDAALVRVADGEREARRAVERRQAARAGAARRLDADHVGAQVGEEPAARLALLVGHVDHAQACERRLGCRVLGLPECRRDMIMSR